MAERAAGDAGRAGGVCGGRADGGAARRRPTFGLVLSYALTITQLTSITVRAPEQLLRHPAYFEVPALVSRHDSVSATGLMLQLCRRACCTACVYAGPCKCTASIVFKGLHCLHEVTNEKFMTLLCACSTGRLAVVMHA